ncbi:ABC transporter ATP-binding protein [Solobacterium moorei]|uniref:ABC transporter, ATP-binding protein n=1 Tax=Solobacterium moorei F0204 TaxID=706433 RepID=E7MKR3_9FIRM|nr:ABC transporter ATP-binding protein [Solobacterium moorei]EFW25338.1 ABC transporter, ATP-binding protein [Solobacterium moorei F0204]MDI6414613.1 ABC transporter ATP-binding protein [Solobacterium moorei]
MLKAFRYLKPYWISVVAVIVLVFSQVQAQLALPDHMSKIITYGIQYGGITESIPSAMSEKTYNHLQVFMDEESKTILEDNYVQVSRGDTSYTKKYPLVEKEDIYVLKDHPDSSLEDTIKKPLLMTSLLENEEILKSFKLDSSSQLYQALALQPQLKEQIVNQFDAMLSKYTDANLTAAQTLAVKKVYQDLQMDTAAIQNRYIMQEGFWMLAISLLATISAIGSAYLSSRTATAASRDLRRDVFAKVETFSSAEFSRFSTASLITRTTNDVQQVQTILTMFLRIVLFAPFMGFTSLFKVIHYSSLVSLLAWSVAGLITLMIAIFSFTMPKFKKSQELVDQLNRVSREQLEGMLVIRAFDNEKYEEQRFKKVNDNITKLNLFLNRVMGLPMPIMTFALSALSVGIIWIGTNQVDAGTMQIGDMMAFLQYATEILMSFMIIAMIFIMVPRSSVSANRIFEILETEPTIHDPVEPKHLPKENAPITFDHVSFKYANAEENVLEDIHFTANPEETVAFIGSTGSGKTTLVNLLPRFFDITEGTIRFGDIDIRDVSQKELRDRIGYVPQKGILFSGTIASNLRYADESLSDEKMEEALSVSQAKEFVDRMPNGVNEPIAQGGTNVSGGQKQRLSIARALAKDAQVYIFDDTFSALDYATDAKLRAALAELITKKHATVFIVAQRISSIMHADKIIVLDQGKMAGIGTHEELLKSCEVYQEIAHSQLSREELGE